MEDAIYKVGGISRSCQGERCVYSVVPLEAYLDVQHQTAPGWKWLTGWGGCAVQWRFTGKLPPLTPRVRAGLLVSRVAS